MTSSGKPRQARGEALYAEQTGRFVRLIEEHPDKALAEYGFNFLYSVDESDAAVFLSSIGLAPESWRQKFLEAVALHRRGKLPEAEKRYRALLSENPKNKEIEYNLAVLHFHKGDLDEARKRLEVFEKHIASVKADEGARTYVEECRQKIAELREEIAQS